MNMSLKHATPLLQVRDLAKRYGRRIGCEHIDFDLYPGEVLCIVGESGSGKSTLLNTLAFQLRPDEGSVRYDLKDRGATDLATLTDAQLRELWRTDWGFVRQNPRDGLRMRVSAGANIGERLMAVGQRHYGDIRDTALAWLNKVEIDASRLDDAPTAFSGGMQQRLQIARNLVTQPRLVFMDEPTAGLDVSVQARFLDLLRSLVAELGLAVILVTHDLAVARLLAHRLIVMRQGRIVETGLTDQVLDDPQHPYTQLLVSSVLAA
ncbi:phosphonate C-P lyase system protein PhnK [Uliginosibacterium sp. H1]|uniref:phosphonate C-P lyase system protein PhnK n=1 Tax=Uliginosibacterium sp. H1 TaxID=3114757 RepID=UPI002E18D991|nr:phosphonate C-P lyase system protein PhnK [Uliginosibacterium sp. H1]